MRLALVATLAGAVPALLLATQGGPDELMASTAPPSPPPAGQDPPRPDGDDQDESEAPLELEPEPVTPPTELAAATVAPSSSVVPAMPRLAPPAPPRPPPADGLAPVISRVETTDPVIFVTIDDGMVRDPAVLDWMRTHDVPVSLFLVQRIAAEGEAYFREMQELGATIHPHSYTHADLTTVDEARRTDEVCGPLDDFEQRFGTRPTLFRPPYGASNEAVQRTTASCGMRAVVLWKGAMNNGQLQLQEAALQPGDVILLHFRDELAQELQVLLDAASAAGLGIGRLEDYL